MLIAGIGIFAKLHTGRLRQSRQRVRLEMALYQLALCEYNVTNSLSFGEYDVRVMEDEGGDAIALIDDPAVGDAFAVRET